MTSVQQLGLTDLRNPIRARSPGPKGLLRGAPPDASDGARDATLPGVLLVSPWLASGSAPLLASGGVLLATPGLMLLLLLLLLASGGAPLATPGLMLLPVLLASGGALSIDLASSATEPLTSMRWREAFVD
jgi:hypothetical protein